MIERPAGGWIEVVCGPMFSGKTEELIRRLKRAEIARQKVQVFKPQIDDRYSTTDIVSHSEQRATAISVRSASEVLERVERGTEVVGLDEAQFFDPQIKEVAERLALDGKRVIVAGLDTDYRGVPFAPMPELIAIAEYVTKLLAICVCCGNPANRNYRLTPSQALVEVGAADRYEARCRLCFAKGEDALKHEAA